MVAYESPFLFGAQNEPGHNWEQTREEPKHIPSSIGCMYVKREKEQNEGNGIFERNDRDTAINLELMLLVMGTY